MIDKKLNDQTFKKLLELMVDYSSSLASQLTSYDCVSKINTITKFHNVFEKIISKKQVRELTDRKIKNKIFNTYHNRLIILLMMESCIRKLPINELLYTYGLMSYILLFNKYLPYCDSNTVSAALTLLRSTHAFNRTSSPDEMVRRLSFNLETKYYTPGNCPIENLELMIIHIRTRIARSLKSFVTAYYKAKQSSKVISFDQNFRNIADQIATKITTIGYIPKIETCSDKYMFLQKIKDFDYNTIFNATYEMLSLIGTSPTRKKISANLRNMLLIQHICRKIGLAVTSQNVACLCLTLLAAGGIE